MVSPLEMYSKFGLANWIHSAKWGKLVGKWLWLTVISSSVLFNTVMPVRKTAILIYKILYALPFGP